MNGKSNESESWMIVTSDGKVKANIFRDNEVIVMDTDIVKIPYFVMQGMVRSILNAH